MNSITVFLKEVRVELAKVAWPTRQQMVQYTLAVIGLSLGLSLFLGLADALFSRLVQLLLVK